MIMGRRLSTDLFRDIMTCLGTRHKYVIMNSVGAKLADSLKVVSCRGLGVLNFEIPMCSEAIGNKN